MENKIKIGHLTINLDTCPTVKAAFEKKYKHRLSKPNEAWDKICEARKKKDKIED